MRFFADQLILGLTDGAIFALVALGYTMVYGIIELINFAHGDVFTMGGYISAAILGFFAINEQTFTAVNLVAILLVFPVVMLIMAAINVGIERIAYRPLRNAPRLAPLITAIGMSFVLEGVMFLWHGPASVHFPDILPHGTGYQTTIGGGFFTLKNVFVGGTTAVLVFPLPVFLNCTKRGKGIRAPAPGPEAGRLVGIGLDRPTAAP